MGTMNAVTAAIINKIKSLTDIRDCAGYVSADEVEQDSKPSYRSIPSGQTYLRRITVCPTCDLFHYGYINESEVGGKYDYPAVKEQECDACSKLPEFHKKVILFLRGLA